MRRLAKALHLRSTQAVDDCRRGLAPTIVLAFGFVGRALHVHVRSSRSRFNMFGQAGAVYSRFRLAAGDSGWRAGGADPFPRRSRLRQNQTSICSHQVAAGLSEGWRACLAGILRANCQGSRITAYAIQILHPTAKEEH